MRAAICDGCGTVKTVSELEHVYEIDIMVNGESRRPTWHLCWSCADQRGGEAPLLVEDLLRRMLIDALKTDRGLRRGG